ncbi:ROK family protein [Anaerococcus sp. AGMB09787]|uniref:ROK family protein n=1 Tax=Anaerococcus sp. AGMB09787 TaxID=2922869 RepID=UPI001FAF7A36|nr:ROK family protein [Anaerococcus sp. AGMB09787]
MYLVFDIGGSAIKYGLIKNEKIVKKSSIKSPPTMDEFLRNIKDLIEKFIDQFEIEAIGFASPGSVDTSTMQVTGLSALGYLGEKNFAKIIADEYKLPVAIENDANCAALGEVFYKDVKEDLLAFVIVGSGIGGAVINKGKILRGSSFESGEFGYMLLSESGKNLSQLATLPNVSRKLKKDYGIDKDTYYIFKKYLEKQEPFYNEVDKMFTYLGMGIYNIAYTINPDVIYIGGAISEDKNYIEKLKEKLGDNRFKGAHIKIKPVSFFNDNNLYGAYANLKIKINEGDKDD